ALSGRTYARNEDWTEERRFYQTGVDAAPGSFRTHILAFFTSLPLTPRNRDRIIADADRALAIPDGLPDSQNSAPAYRDVGSRYRIGGEQGATQGTPPAYWYRKSLAALLRAERLELARDEIYRRFNKGRSDVSYMGTGVYLELGRTYQDLGDSRRALAEFERG